MHISHDAGVVPLSAGSNFVHYASDKYGEKCVFEVMLGVQGRRIIDFRLRDKEFLIQDQVVALEEAPFSKNKPVWERLEFSDKPVTFKMWSASLRRCGDELAFKGYVQSRVPAPCMPIGNGTVTKL
jgi:hypothetical protein